MNEKTSDRGAPPGDRTRCASSEAAPSRNSRRARSPPRLAGEMMNTVWGGAATSGSDTTTAKASSRGPARQVARRVRLGDAVDPVHEPPQRLVPAQLVRKS